MLIIRAMGASIRVVSDICILSGNSKKAFRARKLFCGLSPYRQVIFRNVFSVKITSAHCFCPDFPAPNPGVGSVSVENGKNVMQLWRPSASGRGNIIKMGLILMMKPIMLLIGKK
jgi:hypothetical protein